MKTIAGKDTRNRIVDAARELFHARGYQATSLADICDKAGVNSGSLYYFFKSKDALLSAVLDRYMELMWPVVMNPAFARSDDPIERIFAVLEGYRQMLLMTDCTMGCPIGNLALELSDAKPEIREKIVMNFSNWCAAIEQCLDAVADRLPADFDRARLSRFVLTTMEGGIMQARAQRRVGPYEDAVAQLRDYLDRLLSPGGSTEVKR